MEVLNPLTYNFILEVGFLLHKPYPYTAYIGFSDSSIWDGDMFDPTASGAFD